MKYIIMCRWRLYRPIQNTKTTYKNKWRNTSRKNNKTTKRKWNQGHRNKHT